MSLEPPATTPSTSGQTSLSGPLGEMERQRDDMMRDDLDDDLSSDMDFSLGVGGSSLNPFRILGDDDDDDFVDVERIKRDLNISDDDFQDLQRTRAGEPPKAASPAVTAAPGRRVTTLVEEVESPLERQGTGSPKSKQGVASWTQHRAITTNALLPGPGSGSGSGRSSSHFLNDPSSGIRVVTVSDDGSSTSPANSTADSSPSQSQKPSGKGLGAAAQLSSKPTSNAASSVRGPAPPGPSAQMETGMLRRPAPATAATARLPAAPVAEKKIPDTMTNLGKIHPLRCIIAEDNPGMRELNYFSTSPKLRPC